MLDQLPDYVISDPDNSDHDSDDSDVMITFATSHPKPSYREVSTPAGFRHAICVANQSEQSAYQEASSGYMVIPEGESPDFYVASCEERHANCHMCGNGPMSLGEQDLQALRVDLNVLGVCRQLYEEANHLLWATNTFSFEDRRAFKQFFSSLNPAQKRNLTSIHISANIGTFGSYSTIQHRARRDHNYWGTALNLSNLKMLRVSLFPSFSSNFTPKPSLQDIFQEQSPLSAPETYVITKFSCLKRNNADSEICIGRSESSFVPQSNV